MLLGAAGAVMAAGAETRTLPVPYRSTALWYGRALWRGYFQRTPKLGGAFSSVSANGSILP